MEIRLAKHGNSLGFNLPSSLLKTSGIQEHQRFELSQREDGALILMPLSSARRGIKYTCEMLLEGIPETGLHYQDVSLELTPNGKELDWL